MADFLEPLGQIAGIGGIALGVFLILFREIIRKSMYPILKKEHAYYLFLIIVICVFLVAIAGIGAWIYGARSSGVTNIYKYGITPEKHRADLNAQENAIRQELQTTIDLSGSRKRDLEGTLAEVERRLSDSDVSYRQEIERRKGIEAELIRLKKILPEKQIERALKRFRENGDAVAVDRLLAVAESKGIEYASSAAFHRGKIAVGQMAYGQSYTHFHRAAQLAPENAKYLDAAAWILFVLGRYSEAEPFFKRALIIEEKMLGKDHPSVASTLNNLAEVYVNLSRYAEAELLFKRALIIKEKMLGKDHPTVATTLSNLALLYMELERYEEAEPLINRALANTEKALGKDHPTVATMLGNLAGLYLRFGRLAEAEPLYMRALIIEEKMLGKDHPNVARTLNNLGSLYNILGHYVIAKSLYGRALEILRATFPNGHPRIRIVEAHLTVLQGKMAQ